MNPPDTTFCGFYYQEATCYIEGGSSQLELHSTYDGNSNLVDSNLKVMDVASVFGPYVKFLVEDIGSYYDIVSVPVLH